MEIQFLDHVAIRVKDIHKSAEWYEEVLGLKKVQPEEWKPFPAFVLAGETGVALFPKKDENDTGRVDHFAFRVSKDDLEEAQARLKERGIDFDFQDHKYYHSVYFYDPDGHQVELTAKIMDF